jgi:hypothetical protein
MKQQSSDIHIILISSQPVCSFVWPDWGSNTWSTALEGSMLTITPPMQLGSMIENMDVNECKKLSNMHLNTT